ncbi:Papain-like cysteine peptidase superfamily [Arabidopsis suecica]|uniref:Papain-like cysteine peptidase superfamily n=1 Tax=Arabidopsis suecica TaxID=45249 RepID=A0A8T2CF45_ARASU|nr:Papain-like cysteine peptidase superfamily [Arabidopsis suecica]
MSTQSDMRLAVNQAGLASLKVTRSNSSKLASADNVSSSASGKGENGRFTSLNELGEHMLHEQHSSNEYIYLMQDQLASAFGALLRKMWSSGQKGQSSSTMICQDCGKTSFKFDPFKSLLLPLVGFRSITVTVFDGNGSNLPMPYTVTVAKDGVFNDFSKAISDACLLNSQERLELAQVYEYKSYFVNPLDLLSTIENTDYLVGYSTVTKVLLKWNQKAGDFEDIQSPYRSSLTYIKSSRSSRYGTAVREWIVLIPSGAKIQR